MELTKAGGLAIVGRGPWPNVIIFPTELRYAIPEYGHRALVFESVAGSHQALASPVSGMPDQALFDFGPRAQVQLFVHETGNLEGKFALLMDLDSTTTRALGQFLINLAEKAEAQSN